MRYGIENEDDAALQYSQHFGREVFPVGFVINTSVPHLGCSPDRRVFDATENNSWGLLEIKCPQAENLSGFEIFTPQQQIGCLQLKKDPCLLLSSDGLHGTYWQCMGRFLYQLSQ